MNNEIKINNLYIDIRKHVSFGEIFRLKNTVENSQTFSPLAKNSTNTSSDEDIIKLYLETQRDDYFDILYHKYSSKVYAKCISLLKDEYLAQDAVQEIFMKVLMTLSSFSHRSSFSTWIYTITYNYCIDQIRKTQKISLEPEDKIPQSADSTEIADSVLFEIQYERFKHIFSYLPILEQTLLLMKYQDDISIKEIAEVQNRTESAVKMQLKRTKEKFMKLYHDTYSD